MKRFADYFADFSPVFDFRIKIAHHHPEGGLLESIKNALDAYQLESISQVKSIPIQEHRDFPKLGACECWMFDVQLKYPATTVQIRQTVSERSRVPAECIMVRTAEQDQLIDDIETHGKDHEGAYLNEPEMKADDSGQALVGQARIGSLLKELESSDYKAPKSGEKHSDTNSLDQNTKSPVAKAPKVKGTR